MHSFWKRTRGSEPSQYPQEKKAIAIPSVAASERGSSPNREGVKPVSVALPVLWDVVRSDRGRTGELPTVYLVKGAWKGPP